MTKIGKYDQRISFITEGTTSDGYGGYTPTETTVLTTWAQIEQLSKSSDIEQAQIKFPAVYRVHVMARKSFMPSQTHIVKWNNEKFRILGSPVIDDVRYKNEIVFDMVAK